MNRVKPHRMAKGLTQEALAKKTGVNRSTLSAIENGRIEPGVSTAVRIARVLGVNVETLFPVTPIRKEGTKMADRRAGKVPHVKTKGGGIAPRARNQDGSWRKKRADAGKPRPATRKAK